MITLSYGYKKPQNPDTGDIVFPDLEDNWQQVNDHTHDGVDSALLAVQLQTISASGWTAIPAQPGTSSKLITVPTGFNYDECQIDFRLATGEMIYPSIARVSATQYTIYTNSVQAFVAIYR